MILPYTSSNSAARNGLWCEMVPAEPAARSLPSHRSGRQRHSYWLGEDVIITDPEPAASRARRERALLERTHLARAIAESAHQVVFADIAAYNHQDRHVSDSEHRASGNDRVSGGGKRAVMVCVDDVGARRALLWPGMLQIALAAFDLFLQLQGQETFEMLGLC